jgi:hypothetical protein
VVLLAPLRARLEAMVRMPPRLVASPLAERGPLLGAIRLALDELEPRMFDALDETDAQQDQPGRMAHPTATGRATA